MPIRPLVRRLCRTPAFTATAVVTLALGIGATVAMFTVVDGVLIKALPYPAPEALVTVRHLAPGLTGVRDVMTSPTMYFTYQDDNRAFDALGVFTGTAVAVTGVGDPERVQGFAVTYGTLDALGVEPLLGRMFSKVDDTPGTPETVILGYGYWARRFGGDRDIVGRGITVDGRPREIIGVMPRGFRILDDPTDVLVPLRFNRANAVLGDFSYRSVARLKRGVSIDQASADVSRMLPIWLHSWPTQPGVSATMFGSARLAPSLHPFKQEVVGDVGTVLWTIMAVVGLVLVIACANVANLLLVRADGRQHEFAIRVSLGAEWRHIARELMVESALLAAAGGAIGVALAAAALKLLSATAPANLPRLSDVGLNASTIAFAAAAAFASALAFGIVPIAKYVSPRSLASNMRGSSRATSETRSRHRTRNMLVVAQVTLGVVLLVAAGLIIRTGRALRTVQPGFTAAERIQTVRISISEAQAPSAEQLVRTQQAMRDRLAAIPGVTTATFASSVPMDGNASADAMVARDHDYAVGTIAPIRNFRFVAPGFFDALGTRFTAGRDFIWNEVYEDHPVAIVSDNLARELWGNPTAALGKQIAETNTSRWREVVGVVADVHGNGLEHPAPPTVYWPILMHRFWGQDVRVQRSVTFVVRSERAGTESLVDDIRRAIWRVSSTVPVAEPRTLAAFYERSLARTSFALWVLTIAAGMALLLGIVGIYGVMSYSVTRRVREIGIRVALGAGQGSVRRMVMNEAVVLAGAGVVCGVAAAAGTMRLMSSLLFGVSAFDPATYGGVSIVLIAAAVLASYLPARRAASIDPVVSLRAD